MARLILQRVSSGSSLNNARCLADVDPATLTVSGSRVAELV